VKVTICGGEYVCDGPGPFRPEGPGPSSCMGVRVPGPAGRGACGWWSWCSERFGGWQAGGAPGGVEAGGGADDQGGQQAAGGGPQRDDCGPVLVGGVAGGDGDAEQRAAEPAERGQEQRFGEELEADVAAGGAERAAGGG
jgi:hypothetical protein